MILIAKEYLQTQGLDYFETFSLAVKPSTLRLVLGLAVSMKWPLKQLDIHNAFLNGDLAEVVFMKQPPGFISSSHPTHVFKLTKALYGLKQNPRPWYTKLSFT